MTFNPGQIWSPISGPKWLYIFISHSVTQRFLWTHFYTSVHFCPGSLSIIPHYMQTWRYLNAITCWYVSEVKLKSQSYICARFLNVNRTSDSRQSIKMCYIPKLDHLLSFWNKFSKNRSVPGLKYLKWIKLFEI